MRQPSFDLVSSGKTQEQRSMSFADSEKVLLGVIKASACHLALLHHVSVARNSPDLLWLLPSTMGQLTLQWDLEISASLGGLPVVETFSRAVRASANRLRFRFFSGFAIISFEASGTTLVFLSVY